MFFPCFWTAFCLLFQSMVLGSMHPFLFIPLLVHFFSSYRMTKALWMIAIVGWSVDIFSQHPFGLHAISFCLTSLLIYPKKLLFSMDHPLHFALLSTLFSFCITLFLLFFLFLFDKGVCFTGKWIFWDVLTMPWMDGVFALVFWALPMKATQHTVQRFRNWLKKKNLFPT